MTREEFYKLANEHSEPPESSIFELQIFSYDDEAPGYSYNNETKTWSFKLYLCFDRLYTSLDKAQQALKDYLSEADNDIHSCKITRIPVDVDNKEYGGHLGWWLYDGSGRLIDRSMCDLYHSVMEDVNYGIFFGRSPEQIRFHDGDIVEVHPGEQGDVHLAIINGTPGTVEDVWKLYQEREERWGPKPEGIFKGDYFLDELSDSYFLAGDIGDDFDPDLSPACLMKPTFPVPEEAQKELQAKYDYWLKRTEEDTNNDNEMQTQ